MRLVAAITLLILACPLPAHAVSSKGSFFDATLEVTPHQASDAGAFNVRGVTSCSNSVVMIVFKNYTGADDFEQYRPAFRSRADGRFDYSGSFPVPDRVRPGSAYLYTDQGCGEPDASPSPNVPVTISKVRGLLAFTRNRASASSVVRLSGDQCFGATGTRVTITFSGLRHEAVSAPLKGYSYSLEVVVPSSGGTLTAITSDQDCRGSTQATASITVVTPATLPPATKPPKSPSRPSVPPTTTSTPRVRPFPSPTDSIGAAESARNGKSSSVKGWVIVILGLTGAGAAVAVAALRGRRGRQGKTG